MPSLPPGDPVPSVPLWLGAAGVLPFAALAGALWVAAPEYRPVLADWLRTYAAVILSFLGAVHWGFALGSAGMSEHDRSVVMSWSVVPALVAWVGLLMPMRAGLLLTGAMFVIQYTMDRQLSARYPVPAWYLRLRGGLTAVVILCLVVAAVR